MNGDIIAAQQFEGELYIKASDYHRAVKAAVEAEREKVAQWMMQRGYATGHGDTIEDLLAELDWQIAEKIAIEREACAKVCENIYEGDEGCGDWPTPEMCAEAIRARGQG